MVKQVLKIAASGVVALSLLLSVPQTAAGQTVTAVPQLDLSRFAGKWYELARIPNKPEKMCTSGAMVLYSADYKPRKFQMVTSCIIKLDTSDAWNASGKTDKAGTDGRLKITYLWPFSQKYWVLAVGPAYEWALIGSPNHKSLWVLSRTAEIKPEVLAGIEATAAAEGFNMSKVVAMPQGH